MNVTLIGMKYCGKTTLGAALADRWACPFHDIDRMIEATFTCETGEDLSVREIFTQRGADEFRRIEGMVVCELFMGLSEAVTPHVVSVGGGTATNASVASLLEGFGAVAYLRVPLPALLGRLAVAPVPAFLDAATAAEEYHKLYEQREPVYRELAQLTVDLDGLDVAQSLDRLAAALQEYDHAR